MEPKTSQIEREAYHALFYLPFLPNHLIKLISFYNSSLYDEDGDGAITLDEMER